MLRDTHEPQGSLALTKAEVAAKIFSVDPAELAVQPGTTNNPLAMFEYLDPLGVYAGDEEELERLS